MTHYEIRKRFLKFFEERGHKHVPSSSLLPTDPSVLFTTAGMQQFKPYYTGEADPVKDFGSLNTASIQKCVRTSCIEEVGDATHGTFFEMLGNFSFNNGYWKKEAIQYGLDFVTKELGIQFNRIKVSVFKGDTETPADNESLEIWRKLGFTDEKIIFGSREDNFWGPTGSKGPCGPSTEIYIDGTEVWNIVFNEFFCDEHKKFLPLEKRGIDTGMGLERLAMIIQDKENIFETDLFAPIIGEVRGKNLYDYEKNSRAERIVADHLRAAVFLITDGVRPSNVEQGYVLRRLIRRAIVHAKKLSLPDDVYKRIVHVVWHDIYKENYPELEKKGEEILNVISGEREKFEKAFILGKAELKKVFRRFIDIDPENSPPGTIIKDNVLRITGAEVYKIYESYGLHPELAQELMKSWGMEFDQETLKEAEKIHQEKSRAGAEKKFGGHGLLMDTGELKAGNEEELMKATKLHTATHLLHASLRKVLGNEVKQAGSDITAERLRFDFTFPRKVTPEEIKQVEDAVNDAISKDYKVTKKEMPYEEAIKSGALSFFKLKYPLTVNVYTIGPEKYGSPSTDSTGSQQAGSGQFFSKELCGGPHVTNTGEIGHFKIIKEESISAGTRRIRAIIN